MTNRKRRYDDTSILVAEMCEWGYESGRGKEALERMNWAHGHFKIANDDFLYVLSTYAMLDEAMITSFGFPKPLPLARPLLRGILRWRGHAVRWLPPRRSAHFFTDDRNRTYPEGYRISQLGPPRLVAAQTGRPEADRQNHYPEVS